MQNHRTPVPKMTLLLGGGLLCLQSACVTTPEANSPPLWPLAEHCTRAQQEITRSAIISNNVVHAEYQTFVLSKAKVRPLQTEQYHWYEDAARTQLKMISCKMKTADHLRAEYGAAMAGEDSTCSALNARTLTAVLAAIPARQRSRLRFQGGTQVVFDADALTTDGPTWLAPYPLAYLGQDGALHVQAKAMRNDGQDPRYFAAPPQFRGTRYCHLIAPEHLRRLLTGAVPAVS